MRLPWKMVWKIQLVHNGPQWFGKFNWSKMQSQAAFTSHYNDPIILLLVLPLRPGYLMNGDLWEMVVTPTQTTWLPCSKSQILFHATPVKGSQVESVRGKYLSRDILPETQYWATFLKGASCWKLASHFAQWRSRIELGWVAEYLFIIQSETGTSFLQPSLMSHYDKQLFTQHLSQ